MLKLIRTNKHSFIIALSIALGSMLIVPMLPLQYIMQEQGIASSITLLAILAIYSSLTAQHLPFGTHRVTVKKILTPISFSVIRDNEKIPVNLYGVVPPHVKQEEIYADSMEWVKDTLETGVVQIKAMPNSYKEKNQRMKFTRVLVDGIDIAEEALRQGRLWLDPNVAVPKSYREAQDEGMTWKRGQYKLLREGKIISPFKFQIQHMHKKEEDSIKTLFTNKKQKATQWGMQ